MKTHVHLLRRCAFRTRLAIFSLAATPGLLVAGVGSAESSAVESRVDMSQVSAAEQVDLTTIAEQEGISLVEAYERYGWGEDFSDAVAEIRSKYPNDFVASSMEQGEQPRATVVFASEIPSMVASLLKDLPVPVDLVAHNGVPDAQMNDLVEAVHYKALESASSAHVSTEADEQSGRIRVTLSGKQVTSDVVEAVQEASDATVASRGESFQDRVTVQIDVSDGPGGTLETIRGGAILTFPNSSSLACTSGWAVASTSGTAEGLITARHCDNDLEYTERDVLTWRRSLPANRGDMQFMSSSEDVGHSFYYGVGQYRDVDAPLGTPSNDQYLCFFGRRTGNHCDNVRDTYVCSGDYCNLVQMDDHDTDGGDSGGPWYYGSRPYGVHHGSHVSFFQRRALWTPVYNTIGDITVRIKVGADG